MKQLKELRQKKQSELGKIDDDIQAQYNIVFDDHVELKKVLNNIESLQNYDYMTCNSIDGVDYHYQIDHITSKLNEDELKGLEGYIENNFDDYCGIYFKYLNTDYPCLITSSAEEIFMLDDRYGKCIIVPNRNRIAYQDDHHAFLLAEKWRLEQGIYCGLFVVNNYDDTCEHYDYSIFEKQIMASELSDNEAIKRIDTLLEYYYIQGDFSILDEIVGPYFELKDSTYEIKYNAETKKNYVLIKYKVLLEDVEDFTENYLTELKDKYFFDDTENKDNEATLVITKKVEF